MPRAKADEVKSDNGTVRELVTSVGQPGDADDVLVTYSLPSNAMKFQEAILSLTGDALNEAYTDYCDGVRTRVRQAAYVAAQSESTWITTGKDANGSAIRKDLLTFPVDKFADAFNYMWKGLSSKAMLLDKPVDEIDRGFGAWRAASRRHVENGKLKLATDGTVSVV